jgi:hypothetical protein
MLACLNPAREQANLASPIFALPPESLLHRRIALVWQFMQRCAKFWPTLAVVVPLLIVVTFAVLITRGTNAFLAAVSGGNRNSHCCRCSHSGEQDTGGFPGEAAAATWCSPCTFLLLFLLRALLTLGHRGSLLAVTYGHVLLLRCDGDGIVISATSNFACF